MLKEMIRGGFETEATPGERDATSPLPGAVREWVTTTVIAAVTAYVTSQTGSPELGDVAGQAAGEVANTTTVMATGLAVGVWTLVRKGVQGWASRVL